MKKDSSGYMCNVCFQEIEESVLVFNEEKYEYYHKECEKSKRQNMDLF